jgi:signal transduction histidine kinase
MQAEQATGGVSGTTSGPLSGSLQKSSALAAAAIVLLLALCWVATYTVGGAGHVAPHWFYAPILLAANRFGLLGAAGSAAAAGLLAGPLMPLDVQSGTPQPLSDWTSRAAFFVLIGLLMAWVIIGRRRTEARHAIREAELEALHAIDLSILGALPFRETLAVARTAFNQLLRVDRLGFMLWEPDIGMLHRYWVTENGSGEAQVDLPGQGPIANVIARGEVVAGTVDPTRSSWEKELDAQGMRSFLLAPLVAEGETLGAVAASSRSGPFPEQDVWTIRRVAAQLAVAVRAGRMIGALRATEERRRKLLGQLMRAEEDERRRIAGDIHDDSVQAMTAAAMRLDLLKEDVSDPEHLEMLEKTRHAVGDAIGRLRGLLFDLHPPALDREGLIRALQLLGRGLDKTDVAIKIETGLRSEPPEEARAVLFRIAQEALTNVRKHADATSVRILVEEKDGGFSIRLEDNGRGFLASEAEERAGHLGLPGMQERAQLAGGWCRVEGMPGNGTTVEAWVPGEPQKIAARPTARPA